MKIRKIAIKNKISELERINNKIERISDEWEISEHLSFNINLVIEEIFSNIVFYGYRDKNEHKINITFTSNKDHLKIKIEDDAQEFNPLFIPTHRCKYNSPDDAEVGGLGIHLVKNIMDDLKYSRKHDRNILIMKKKITQL